MTEMRLRRRAWLCGSSALVGALAASVPVMAQTVPPATRDVAVAPATSTAVAGPTPTSIQTTAAPPTVGEIVVTAQKREQSINQVPLSITAVSGDALTQRGITSTADLAKVVPGFVFAPSPFQEPVYVLRGVGLYDSGLGSSPAVTVYLDQFPLPYPIMTEVAPLDLQRVEALKGPQGTLFGQNSTGGAINYIAAKPTKAFEAGGDITGERFGQVQADGFVSGPLTDTLGARLSFGTTQGGAYQYSVTRPNGPDLGNADTGQGRLILDWHPIEKLRFELNANGFYDGSDTQALQLSSVNPGNPARATPALLAAPIVGDDPRAAEFPAGYAFRSHDTFYQVALRTDYEVSPALTLTSLTSYDHVNVNKLVDISGLDAAGEYNNLNTVGRIRTVSQELRGGGAIGPLTYVVGGNYDNSGIIDGEIASLNGTTDQPLPFLPPFHVVEGLQHQTVNDYALFGNVDYRLPANLTFHGGIRGTESDRHASFCSYDPNGATDGDPIGNLSTELQTLFSAIGIKTTPVSPILPGGAPNGCTTLTPAPAYEPSFFHSRLDERNLSWKVGLDYRLPSGGIVYASDSVGYKSGLISPVLATSTTQLAPVKQERLDAYEVGIKTPLLDRRLQFNLAGFYYSYDDQQLRTKFTDPIFGSLQQLVNIPRSQLWGLDGDIEARPIQGLTLSVSGTYIESDVTQSFVSQNAAGVTGDLKGSELPYTPKEQVVADGQYEFPLNDRYKGFLGSSLTYHGVSNATFNSVAAPAPEFKLKPYTVVDLRGGVGTQDGAWRLTGFIRNLSNEYLVTTVIPSNDSVARLAGPPKIFGVTLSYRYH